MSVLQGVAVYCKCIYMFYVWDRYVIYTRCWPIAHPGCNIRRYKYMYVCCSVSVHICFEYAIDTAYTRGVDRLPNTRIYKYMYACCSVCVYMCFTHEILWRIHELLTVYTSPPCAYTNVCAYTTVCAYIKGKHEVLSFQSYKYLCEYIHTYVYLYIY